MELEVILGGGVDLCWRDCRGDHCEERGGEVLVDPLGVWKRRGKGLGGHVGCVWKK